MEHLRDLFADYRRILIFDTETTGLDFARDEIIQFSGVTLVLEGEDVSVEQQYDRLIQLAPGQTVPPEIERLTGIHPGAAGAGHSPGPGSGGNWGAHGGKHPADRL